MSTVDAGARGGPIDLSQLKAAFTAPHQLASPSTLSLLENASSSRVGSYEHGNGVLPIRRAPGDQFADVESFSSSVESSQGLSPSSARLSHESSSTTNRIDWNGSTEPRGDAQSADNFPALRLSSEPLLPGPPMLPARQAIQTFDFVAYGEHGPINFQTSPSTQPLHYEEEMAPHLTVLQPRPILATANLAYSTGETSPPPPPEDEIVLLDTPPPPPPPEENFEPAPPSMPAGLSISASNAQPSTINHIALTPDPEQPDSPDDEYRFQMADEFSESEGAGEDDVKADPSSPSREAQGQTTVMTQVPPAMPQVPPVMTQVPPNQRQQLRLTALYPHSPQVSSYEVPSASPSTERPETPGSAYRFRMEGESSSEESSTSESAASDESDNPPPQPTRVANMVGVGGYASPATAAAMAQSKNLLVSPSPHPTQGYNGGVATPGSSAFGSGSMASPPTSSRQNLSPPGRTPSAAETPLSGGTTAADVPSLSFDSSSHELSEVASSEDLSVSSSAAAAAAVASGANSKYHQVKSHAQQNSASNGFFNPATLPSPTSSSLSAAVPDGDLYSKPKRSARRTIGTDFFSNAEMAEFHSLLANPNKSLVVPAAISAGTNYGPQVQPPLISGTPAGFDRFVYVYTHPMETPAENGKFAEQGRYLVDGDMPTINATVTTKFIAPRASMLSDRFLQLPPSVTVVDLAQNSRLTDKVFSRIPPSVTYLDLRSITVVSDASLDHLPRTLQFLNLRDAHDITDSGLSKLPKTLKHLKLSGRNKDFTCDAFGKLPSALETLKINHLQKLTKRSCMALRSRLVGLTRLDLPGVTQMRDKCLKYLPPLLRHLNIRSVISLTGAALSSLPQSLEFLDISSLPLQDHDLTQLPPTLAKLCVTSVQSTLTTSGLQGLTSKTLQVLDLQAAFVPGLADTFPATLTALRFRMLSPAVDNFFNALPASLQLLDVIGPKWEDKHIAKGDLPWSLTWIALDADSLTPRMFNCFPKGLQYLNLRRMAPFGAKSLLSLPKSLRHLQLEESDHNKRLLKECGRTFANFLGSPELASFGEYVFGPQDDTEERPSVEDQNLWTSPGNVEVDTHDFTIGPDGKMMGGVGYLVPLNTLKIPGSWTAPPFKLTPQPIPIVMSYDSTQPTMSPFDLHNTARRVARRVQIPDPSSTARMFRGDATDADLSQLQQNVAELHAPSATSLSEAALATIPRDLIYLNLRSARNFTSSKALFHVFKKRKLLRTVILESNDFKSMQGVGHFPKSLTALDLTSSTRLGDGCIEAMPSGLTWLSIGSPKIKATFPINLTVLNLENVHKVKAEFVAHLPRSITHLDFHRAVEVEPTAISALPKHQLKFLNFHYLETLRESSFLYLPRSLQFLSLASNAHITDKGIEALPRNLLHLDLSKTQLTMLGIAALPSTLGFLSVDVDPTANRIECIAYLPRGLRILNYGGDIRDSWIEFLPPHLQFLNLSHATSFTAHGIAALPPALTYLNIHSWHGALVSASWSCKRLAVLDIFNADVANTDIQTLPRSIKYINSASMQFQANCAAYFHQWNGNPARVIQENLYPQGGYE